MLVWLQTNIGTIAASLALAAAIFAIIRKILRDKRAGRHACGCGGCAGCAAQGQCHKS